MERELYYAIGDYLLVHIERHGHARTAEAFGVSRHTLWRFLERGQPGRALTAIAPSRASRGAQQRAGLKRPRRHGWQLHWMN